VNEALPANNTGCSQRRAPSPKSSPFCKRALHHIWIAFLALLFALPAAAQTQPPEFSEQNIQTTLQRTIGAIRHEPDTFEQFDYIMTARVRLLLFWAGADDVGGGYIRLNAPSPNAAPSEWQLVMGSDPAKAPMSINRWGAAWELSLRDPSAAHAASNAFFGFMKVSKGTSVLEMQKELSQEKDGGSFLFSATVGETNPSGSLSKTVPFPSNQDFTIHQLDQAESAVFDKLAEPGGQVRTVDVTKPEACTRTEGFLSSVSDLIDAGLENRKLPVTLCYLFNGERFTIKLTKVTHVPHETVSLTLHQEPKQYTRNYDDLLLAHFDNFNETTKKPSSFELLLGTTGKLRGIPVRIMYQPNWWFQVILNVKTPETQQASLTR
jgi:hypothetical protein